MLDADGVVRGDDLCGDTLPEHVLEVAGLGHPHVEIAVGLLQVVGLAQAMEISEAGETTLGRVGVIERINMVDLCHFSGLCAPGECARHELGDESFAHTVGNRVGGCLRIERCSGRGVGQQPSPGGGVTRDPSCHIRRYR